MKSLLLLIPAFAFSACAPQARAEGIRPDSTYSLSARTPLRAFLPERASVKHSPIAATAAVLSPARHVSAASAPPMAGQGPVAQFLPQPPSEAALNFSARGVGELAQAPIGGKAFSYYRGRGRMNLKDCVDLAGNGRDKICARLFGDLAIGLARWIDGRAGAALSYEHWLSPKANKIYIDFTTEAQLNLSKDGFEKASRVGVTAGVAHF